MNIFFSSTTRQKLLITAFASIAFVACSPGSTTSNNQGTTAVKTDDIVSDVKTNNAGVDQTTIAILSSDLNFAKSLLYRWWFLFESPSDINHDSYFNSLFHEDLNVALGPVKLNGREEFKAAFDSLPDDMKSAHHLESFDVIQFAKDKFSLNATFVFDEERPDAEPRTMRTQYKHTLVKNAEGRYVFTEVTAKVLDELEARPFQSSYQVNRARASINHYLGASDNLNSDYDNLKMIMNGTSEVHGMFDPSKVTFNSRGDGVLIGSDEIANWLSSRKETFNAVSHELVDIDLVSQSENVYVANVDILAQAWPKSGDPIKVTLPITITLRDTGRELLTIEKIER